LASLLTQDAVLRIPAVNVEFVGRQEIRAGLERLREGLWDYLVQTTHPGTIHSRATPPLAVHTSRVSGTCATAARI
jgi:hypothetical protein